MSNVIETSRNNAAIALYKGEIKLGRTMPCNKPGILLLERSVIFTD
jgi:hypothetical protein